MSAPGGSSAIRTEVDQRGRAGAVSMLVSFGRRTSIGWLLSRPGDFALSPPRARRFSAMGCERDFPGTLRPCTHRCWHRILGLLPPAGLFELHPAPGPAPVQIRLLELLRVPSPPPRELQESAQSQSTCSFCPVDCATRSGTETSHPRTTWTGKALCIMRDAFHPAGRSRTFLSRSPYRSSLRPRPRFRPETHPSSRRLETR